MTTSAAWIQLPHGWLFRESDGSIKYQAPNGQHYSAECAYLHNADDQNIVFHAIATLELAAAGASPTAAKALVKAVYSEDKEGDKK